MANADVFEQALELLRRERAEGLVRRPLEQDHAQSRLDEPEEHDEHG